MRRASVLLGCLLWCIAALASDFGWNPDLGERARHPRHAGYVGLHVIGNLDLAPARFEGWSALRVRRIDGPRRSYTLQGTRAGTSSGQVFAGALPAGDYELVSLWTDSPVIAGGAGMTLPFPAEMARFQVRAGRFSDLGTFAHTHALRAQRTPRNPFVRQLPTGFWRLPSRPGLLGWLHGTYPALRPVRALQAAEAGTAGALPPGPVVAFGTGATPRRFDDGTIVFPDRLGHVRIRAQDGSWRALASGFSVDLHDALLFEGDLLVAGDRGLIARLHAGSRTWSAEAGPAGDLVVHWLGVGADGRAHALGHTGDEAQLLRRDDTGWVVVARFGRRQGFRASDGGRASWALLAAPGLRTIQRSTRASVLSVDADGLRLAVGRKRWHYRYADGELQAQDSGPALASVQAQPNGALVALLPADGAVEDALYSRDGGHQWLPSRRPSAAGNLGLHLRSAAPYVDDAGGVWLVGPRLARDSQLRIVASPGLHLLSAREPGKRLAWEALAPIEAGCARLLGSLSRDDEWFLQCSDTRILHSRDRGGHWQQDWPPPQPEAGPDAT